MRDVKRKKFYCVQCTTAAEFEARVNRILAEISEPELTFPDQPFTAYILGVEWERVPETLADDFTLRGESYNCGECPYFVRANDLRRRWHTCGFSHTPTREDTPACDDF